MSDQKPPKPSVSTSTVPLKKETVRISLRAQPEDSGPIAPKGSTAPIPAGGPTTAPVPPAGPRSGPTAPTDSTTPLPSGGPATDPIDSTTPLPSGGPTTAAIPGSAPTPPKPSAAPAPPSGAPSPPPAPSAPRPPAAGGPPAAPAGPKTIPLSKGPDPLSPTKPVQTGPDPLGPTAPVGTGLDPLGPTKPVATAGVAAAPVGAKTIPLAKAPGSGGGGAVGKATVPLKQGGAKPLPQATVKMGSTQAMGGAGTQTISKKSVVSTTEEVEEEWEEEYEESGLMPFAIIVLILSLAVLAIELVTKMGAGG